MISVPVAATVLACSGPAPMATPPNDLAGQVDVRPADGSEKVDPDREITVDTRAKGSRITDVVVTDASGRQVRGRLSPRGEHWRSNTSLAAGVRYTVRVQLITREGDTGLGAFGFTTAPADKLLRATFGPEGKRYGVGQPITAQLSHKVSDRAARAVVERGLRVSSHPQHTGRWYWVDDRTLHYRPREYWPAHATVTVHSNLHGVRIQEGLHGGSSRPLSFTTGDRVEAVVDAAAHRMTVHRNGRTVRSIPVTTGKPGFATRNGTKVVLSQEETVRMTGSSIGIPAGSADSYDLQVRWATRVTWSGEYVHAAPWSTGNHGVANVSHGCTGMGTEAARWFFNLVRPGDLITVINSEGEQMTPFDNGFGDWNLTWEQWRRGSAVEQETALRESTAPARLSPQTT
ncbi:hypothetical protein AQ490_18325 [Wenjunlia vitaminophila]|uniref:L,D-TPase catalytic domain-containing protein n=2 Tax=Wenjunlia vitaminophila TaxID=76728 RepID=A0A0T6LV39_WENVI|nr:hypothetical protein AQ490_18325 [Wenjunlia vitaminophila]